MSKKLIFIVFLFLNSYSNAQSFFIKHSIGATAFFSDCYDSELNGSSTNYIIRPHTSLSLEFFYKKIGIHSGIMLHKGARIFKMPSIFGRYPKVNFNYLNLQFPILLTSKLKVSSKVVAQFYAGINIGLSNYFESKTGKLKRLDSTPNNEIAYTNYFLPGLFPTFAGNLGFGLNYVIAPKVVTFLNLNSVIGFSQVINDVVEYSFTQSQQSVKYSTIINTKSDLYLLQIGMSYRFGKSAKFKN
jgi:hypothetical protein